VLTSSERHFIQSWKEQRQGPRWKYYVQYTIAWGIVTFLVLFFLLKLIISERDMGGPLSFYIILPLSIIIAFTITHFTYVINERRLMKIIQKEKELNGMDQEKP
jgi:uncharacterized membrane protein